MGSYNQKAVDRILHPIEGGKIGMRDKMIDEGERTYIDFDEYDYITKKVLEGFNPPVSAPLTFEIPVTGSGLVINWQTDLIDGVQTYAAALGNNLPKPVHYFKDGNNYTDGSVKPAIVRVSGDITTVTFDWGYSTDCVIVF